MTNDFLKELEFLGVTARLKRLSDVLSGNIKALYKYHNIDIEPSWHLVFLMLKKEHKCTMVEIADALHLSQPAMTKMVNRMSKKAYINISRDKNDSRKKIVQLSNKAKKELPKFEKIWDAGQKSIKEILESNTAFLEGLEAFEIQIDSKNFKTRALEHLKNG